MLIKGHVGSNHVRRVSQGGIPLLRPPTRDTARQILCRRCALLQDFSESSSSQNSGRQQRPLHNTRSSARQWERLPGGRQALLGDVDGWNMIVGFSHDAVVFRNNSQSFLRLVRFAPQSVSKPDRRYGSSEMTLIDRTERQTSEDVIFQGGGWIIKGFFGWALVLSAVGV